MRFLFAFSILLLTQVAFTQTYVPFDMDSARWFMEDVSPVLGPGDAHSYWEEWIDGDTMVNGVEYRKVYTKNRCSSYPDRQNNGAPIYRPPSNPNTQLIGGLREEDKRVYFLRFENAPATSYRKGFSTIIPGNEYLLYDFNATVGDTIYHGELQAFEVINGDTSYRSIFPRSIVLREDIQQGQLRVQVNANNTTFISQENDVVTEKIGSRAGLLGPLRVSLNSIRCYFPNYISANKCPMCPGISTGTDEGLTLEVSIFPNPTEGPIYLEGEYDSYRLISVLGLQLEQGRARHQLNFDEYPSGYYYLIIQKGDLQSVQEIILR